MSVTIVKDCVDYRDERYHPEAMRQMADRMGASGIDYQELMDDLAGMLVDIVSKTTLIHDSRLIFNAIYRVRASQVLK
jgi:hypothetical protein